MSTTQIPHSAWDEWISELSPEQLETIAEVLSYHRYTFHGDLILGEAAEMFYAAASARRAASAASAAQGKME